MRRRVTFSRNFTLSLSRTCRCYCKYCSFATHKPHLYAPDEVEALLERAVRRERAKELLVLTGERPEVNDEVKRRLAELHSRHGHIQEVILQNFVPHQSYYGREPAEIADAAADEYWRTGLWSGPHREAPDWACAVTIDDMKRLVAEARRLLPGVGIQVPPNLSDWWVELVRAGATDLGGLSINGDHISPEHPFPSPGQIRKRLAAEGMALTERLCVYPEYID